MLHLYSGQNELWVSGTPGTAAITTMQGDGNFVSYSSCNTSGDGDYCMATLGSAYWASDSNWGATPSYSLNLLSNCNLEVVDSDNNIVWLIGSPPPPPPSLPPPPPPGTLSRYCQYPLLFGKVFDSIEYFMPFFRIYIIFGSYPDISLLV